MSSAAPTRSPRAAAPSHPLDIAHAAAYLGVSERWVRRAVAERRVRHYKVGKLLRFDPRDLDAFLAEGVREAVPR